MVRLAELAHQELWVVTISRTTKTNKATWHW